MSTESGEGITGGVATVYTDGGTEAAWSNPSFATDEALGNSNATLDADAGTPILNSEWLRINSFGIEIPAGRIIQGIELQARCKHTDATETARIEVRLTTGTDKSDHLSLDTGSETITLAGTAFEEISVGSSTELWGRIWAPSLINSFTFGIAAQMRIDGVGGSVTDVNRIDLPDQGVKPGSYVTVIDRFHGMEEVIGSTPFVSTCRKRPWQ